MGNCGMSVAVAAVGSGDIADNSDMSRTDTSYSREWVKLPTEGQAKDNIGKSDGSMVDVSVESQVQLRALLDYPIAQQYMRDSCLMQADILQLVFSGWFDIKTFKAMPKSTARSDLAVSIAKKYVDGNVIINPMEQQRIDIELCSPTPVSLNLFDTVHSEFFQHIHNNFFMVFRRSPAFKQMAVALRRKYNSAIYRDFDYMHLL